jgi:hypothetical protein
MEWGKMMEAMALRMHTARHADITVYEFGLVPHPQLSCFGASPDGISELGVMIEIKCPYTREIKKDYIPDYYELQMQGQMAVCGLTDCDYIECKISQHTSFEAYAQAARRTEYVSDHGIVVVENGEYMYSGVGMSPNEAHEWATAKATTIKAKVVMWSLDVIQIQRVKFDSERWEKQVVPKVQQFWEDVLKARANKSNVSPPKRVKFIEDDD